MLKSIVKPINNLIKIYPGSSIANPPPQIHLILSSHLHHGLPKVLFPSGIPTKTLYAFLDICMYATCLAHLSCFDLRFLIMLREEYNAYNFNIMLLSPIFSNCVSLLTPNMCVCSSANPLYYSEFAVRLGGGSACRRGPCEPSLHFPSHFPVTPTSHICLHSCSSLTCVLGQFTRSNKI